MNKILRTTLAVSVCLSLAACDESDSKKGTTVSKPPAPTPTTLAITGQAVKGILAGALVEVFNASDMTTAVGSAAQTDETGHYTVTITDPDGNPIVGAFVVRVSSDEDTTMVCDAVVCGDVERKGIISAEDLAGFTLSTFTYSDGADNIEADVNALTTMATVAILSSAEVNENIDLSGVTQEGVISLQLGASQVVGSILGFDLSATNIYSVNIIDATTFTEDSSIDAVTATLTLINASFSGLDSDVAASRNNFLFSNKETDERLGAVIAKYFSTFKAIVDLLVVSGADLNSVSAEQLAVINSTQAQFSGLVDNLISEIGADTGVQLEVEEILTEVDLQVIIDIINVIDVIEVGTGGTDS